MEPDQVYVTNEAEVDLPALQSSRRAVWDYYRLEFLPNGYPGRRTGGALHAHPIYGPYVIADYLAQFRRSQDETFLTAAKRVANAALEHMTPIGAALAFRYDQEKAAVSSKKGSWYSGLTQARYLETFSKLLQFPGTAEFASPLDSILASLEVPVQDGGVAWKTKDDGLIIEEYPSLAPDCTLNGWTTATCILRDYAAKQSDERAWDLFHRSVRGLEALVPLYDVPEYATSRYGLKGSATLKLLPLNVDVSVESFSVDMPGTGVLDANRGIDPAGAALTRGHRRIKAGAQESFTVELSRRTFPRPNSVIVQVDSSDEGSLRVLLGDGPYDPMTKRLVPKFENDLGTFPLRAGVTVLQIPVPWTDAELIAYPTNFGKAIAGRQFNQYHWIHVDTLAKIAEHSGSDILGYYHERWRKSPQRWPSMRAYQDSRITLERFDPKLHA